MTRRNIGIAALVMVFFSVALVTWQIIHPAAVSPVTIPVAILCGAVNLAIAYVNLVHRQ